MPATATPELKTGTEVEMKFAWIPPGRFLIGSEKSDGEKPVHRVTISKGFWMGIYPVTQWQFEAVMGYNPSHFRGPDRPVENVTWFEAQEFCQKFGELTGKPIRLPTEAEWEYACRAGTTSDYFSGNDEAALKRIGWYGGDNGPSKGQTQPVGKLEKNSWGLFDVHGNVWEWCEDWYAPYATGDQMDPCQLNKQSSEWCILRGGGWDNNPDICHATFRNFTKPANHSSSWGFRVCFRLD
jgi:formylglycine-generating enzyme required for sulfatase activity